MRELGAPGHVGNPDGAFLHSSSTHYMTYLEQKGRETWTLVEQAWHAHEHKTNSHAEQLDSLQRQLVEASVTINLLVESVKAHELTLSQLQNSYVWRFEQWLRRLLG